MFGKKNKKKKEEEFKEVEVPKEILEQPVQEQVVEEVAEDVTEIPIPQPIETPEVETNKQPIETDKEILELEERIKNIKIKQEQIKLAGDSNIKTRVVKELPQSPARVYEAEDGSTINLITTEEAIEENNRILNEILSLLKKK